MADIISKKGLADLGAKACGQIGGNALAAIDPDVALNTIITSYLEYKQVVAQEKTKREQIRAWRDVELERIRAQEELFLTYLDRVFDERRANFAKFFEVLDHAIETENVGVITATLDSITTLAKTSPFKDIATVVQVREALEDPDGTFSL